MFRNNFKNYFWNIFSKNRISVDFEWTFGVIYIAEECICRLAPFSLHVDSFKNKCSEELINNNYNSSITVNSGNPLSIIVNYLTANIPLKILALIRN